MRGRVRAGSMNKQTFEIWSPQLRNRRPVDVYLPASYGAGRTRYPVIYAHDGQNLSDPSIAFGGTTWQLEGALEHLRSRGLEAIVIGLHNTGQARLAEYSPFADAKHGGGAGPRYVRFLVDTVKPRIDAAFRTRRDRDSTVMLGSSMGGLLSLYAFFARPSPFGRVAAMSPSVWFGQRKILAFVERARFTRGRIYVDIGTSEGAQTLRDARALACLLREKGYDAKDTLQYVEAAGHRHTEADWARRLPHALEFLLRPDARVRPNR
jgi:predicted alpha/beta superfamily hydrolase